MRKVLALALTGLLMSLGGCAVDPSRQAGTADYRVYYSALGDQTAAVSVGYETCELSEDAQPVPELLQALFQGPDGQKLSSPFPEGVSLLEWSLEDGRLSLDLSEQYGSLTGVDLTIADACLTLTLCQVAEVESVYVTVEGAEIPYRPIQQLAPEDLLLSNGQESPPPAEPSDPANGNG